VQIYGRQVEPGHREQDGKIEPWPQVGQWELKALERVTTTALIFVVFFWTLRKTVTENGSVASTLKTLDFINFNDNTALFCNFFINISV